MSESPVPRSFSDSCMCHIIPTCRRFAEACRKNVAVAHRRPSTNAPKMTSRRTRSSIWSGLAP